MSFTTVQKAFLAVIVANFIWGAAAPIFKISLDNIPPFTLAFWRFFLGALILLALLRKQAALTTKSKKDLLELVAYALTGITINIIFFFWGLRLTYSINSPVIASGAPILTFFLALMFLKEPFSLKKFMGMSLGTLGILAIVFEPLLKHGADGSVLGNLFLVIATIAAVFQTIIGRSVMPRFNPFMFTFWAFVIGSASFLPLALYEYATIPNLYTVLDWRGYMGIFYGAVFSSAAGYGLYAWGLSKVSATDASMFTYLDPVIGTILGYFVLHEPITSYFVLGAVLIFGGIFIAEGRINYHPIHRVFSLGFPQKPALHPYPVKPPKVLATEKSEIIKKIFDHKPQS